MEIDEIDQNCPRGENATKDTPFNGTCLEDFFNNMNLQLRRFSEWESTLYTVIYIIVSLFALIGNGVVILAVIRKKEMRTNRNVLIVNLALSNLMLALTTIPFLWLPSMYFEFPYSNFFCKFANALPGSNIYCSTLTISVMAVDRYYSVKNMSLGTDRRQCLRAVIISVFIWVLSFLLSFPLLVYYQTSMLYVFKNVSVIYADSDEIEEKSYGWRQCHFGSLSAKTDESETEIVTIQRAMSTLQVLFLYVIPLVVLAIFNIKLTRFLKVNAKQVSRGRGTSTMGVRRGSLALTQNNACIMSEPTTADNSARLVVVQNSGASMAERASQRRRNRTTALLIAMALSYAVLWCPYTVITLLIDLEAINLHTQIIERVDQAFKLISILSICINPMLYGFLNTNFRHEFTDIFHTVTRCVPRSTKNSCASSNSYSIIRTASNKRCSQMLHRIRSLGHGESLQLEDKPRSHVTTETCTTTT
uniref:G_PROTEIN_RECEP_F1_2 domain-containing protein n=1 Tax=Panagrellus redivivus TaxID=6233 RepID=A0A7E4W6J7_PANRE